MELRQLPVQQHYLSHHPCHINNSHYITNQKIPPSPGKPLELNMADLESKIRDSLSASSANLNPQPTSSHSIPALGSLQQQQQHRLMSHPHQQQLIEQQIFENMSNNNNNNGVGVFHSNDYDTGKMKTIFLEMSSSAIDLTNNLQNQDQQQPAVNVGYTMSRNHLFYEEPTTSSTSSTTSSQLSACSADRKRPYPCALCPSKFGSKMELEEHQNSHTGMKPFQCDLCHSRFNRRSTLWNHKRIHSDAKPFVCTVCQMTFKWKNSLKCHKEMHYRKNEMSSIHDNDIRLLTYATAAKKQLGVSISVPVPIRKSNLSTAAFSTHIPTSGGQSNSNNSSGLSTKKHQRSPSNLKIGIDKPRKSSFNTAKSNSESKSTFADYGKEKIMTDDPDFNITRNIDNNNVLMLMDGSVIKHNNPQLQQQQQHIIFDKRPNIIHTAPQPQQNHHNPQQQQQQPPRQQEQISEENVFNNKAENNSCASDYNTATFEDGSVGAINDDQSNFLPKSRSYPKTNFIEQYKNTSHTPLSQYNMQLPFLNFDLHQLSNSLNDQQFNAVNPALLSATTTDNHVESVDYFDYRNTTVEAGCNAYGSLHNNNNHGIADNTVANAGQPKSCIEPVDFLAISSAYSISNPAISNDVMDSFIIGHNGGCISTIINHNNNQNTYLNYH